MNKDGAETLALQALSYLAQDTELMGGFLAHSGLGPADLRAHAGDPEVLAGVLDFLLTDEERLLAFCDSAEIDPTAPARARSFLPGGDIPHWT